jgi:hypothetical protein
VSLVASVTKPSARLPGVALKQPRNIIPTPTKEYPYPKTGRIRFYLVCYSEVRVIDADFDSVKTGKDKCSDLFEAAQKVITELRLITQQRQAGQQP